MEVCLTELMGFDSNNGEFAEGPYKQSCLVYRGQSTGGIEASCSENDTFAG